jgi:hypothetical protein
LLLSPSTTPPRLADRWRQLQLGTLPAWNDFLRGIGYDGRGVDTLGTLLAIGWIMREDAAPTQLDADVIADQLHNLLREDRAERAKSFDRFMHYLLGMSVDPMRKGEWRTLLELVKLAAGYGATPEAERRVESDAMRYAATDDQAIDAQRQLSRLGIRIGRDEDGERTFLLGHLEALAAIDHAALQVVFGSRLLDLGPGAGDERDETRPGDTQVSFPREGTTSSPKSYCGPSTLAAHPAKGVANSFALFRANIGMVPFGVTGWDVYLNEFVAFLPAK